METLESKLSKNTAEQLNIMLAKSKVKSLLCGTWWAPIKNIKNAEVEEMEFKPLSFSEVEEYVEGLLSLLHENSTITLKKEEILKLLQVLKTNWRQESSQKHVEIMYNTVLKLKDLMMDLGWIIVPLEEYERYESCILVRFKQSS